MITENQLHLKFKMRIVFAGLFFLIAGIVKGADDKQIVLKVVGPDNEVLPGAKIYHEYSRRGDKQVGKEYICDNNGLVYLPEKNIFKYEWQKEENYIGEVLYGLYKEKMAGFVVVKGSDLGKEIELKLTPACRVHGSIKSNELTKLGQKVEWTNVYVTYVNNGTLYHQSLSCISTEGKYEFFLPIGRYELYAYGTRLYQKKKDIKVRFWQKDKKVGFNLPADRLANLRGKDAPELQQIQGWINSKPLKLADLRGKVVLLDFWGVWCSACVGVTPDLIDLHNRYHNKGLVIIGIHDDSMNSVKELEEKIEQLSKKHWKNKKLSFAIALDGGGRCKIEGTKQTAKGATTAAYGINAFPTMVLIDKQGKVVDDYYPDKDNKILKKLLAGDDIDNQP